MAVTKIQAKTARNRQEVKAVASALLKQLTNKYRLSPVDSSIHTTLNSNEVARDLANIGYKPDSLDVYYPMDPHIGEDAKIYSLSGKSPLLVRDSPKGWGTMIIYLGRILPKFKSILGDLRQVAGVDRHITVSNPAEGVFGIAIKCRRPKTGPYALDASVISVLSRLGVGAGFVKADMFGNSSIEAYLLAEGFTQIHEFYVNKGFAVKVDDCVTIIDYFD